MPRSPLAAVARHIHALAERAPGTAVPDRQLLERFLRQHDEAAFAVLVRRHGGMVLSVARRILHDAHAAEDIFQTTFLTLARAAASIRQHDALPSWLYGVAARLASQARRQEARRKARERTAAAPPSPDVTEAAAWRELGAALDEELQRLPEKYRTPLVLIYFAGQTQETAAAQLGWSKGTLRRRLERGKQLLHARLLRRGVSLSVGLLTAAIAQSAVSAALPLVLIQRTVAEAVKVITTQATGSLIGVAFLTRARIALALTLLVVSGGGLAVLPLASSPPAEENPPVSAPPASEAKPARVAHFDDPLPPRALARLGTARFRQGGEVNALAFSPDGKLLASAGGWSDDSVHLWETATGKEVRRLTGLTQQVRTVVFSPDGKIIAAGSDDGALRFWEVHTGRPAQPTDVISVGNGITSSAFAPNGKLVAFADANGHVVYLADVTRRAGGLTVLRGHNAPVRSVVFSPDGKTLASAGLDKSIHLWDIDKGKSRLLITGHKGGILSLYFSPDGKQLASASQDKTVRVWDTATGKELLQIKGHTAAVHAVAFSPDGKTLASGSDDWTLRLWDAASGRPRGQPHRHLAAVCSVAFSPDGKRIASGGGFKECSIRLWDAATGKEHAFGQGHYGWIGSLHLAADGRTLYSAGYDARLLRWDLATGKIVAAFDSRQSRGKAVAFSPDGKTVAAGSDDKCVYVWELAGGRELHRIQGHTNQVRTVAYTRDGKTLLSSSWDRSVRFWDVAGDREQHQRREPLSAGAADAFALPPDGKTVLVGGHNGTVTEYELAGGNLVRSLPPASGSVERLVFSPDDQLLALCSLGGTLEIRNAAGDQVIHRLTRDPGAIYNLAFSPDGRSLASVGVDRTVRVWETATGKERVHFAGHRGAASAVLFAPDGRILYTGSSDSTILVWDLTGRLEKGCLRPATLKPEEVEALENDLSGEDAARAYQALWKLAAAPRQALPLLKMHLRPATVDARRLAQLLNNLDDDSFAVRDKASQELARLGDAIKPDLVKAQEGTRSPEVRRRLQQLLDQLDHNGPAFRQRSRMLEVLEQMDAPEARQHLEALARGTPQAWITEQAKAALRRLARRPAR